MKFLVIGGAGFIGSNLCQRLLLKGHEVICLDNLSTGFKQNIVSFVYNPSFNFVLHDITEPYAAANVDCIIHCANPVLSDSLHFLKTCSQGAFNVAGIARRNNARVIYLSNSEIYGNIYDLKLPEEGNSVINNNTVASGYLMAEAIFNNYKNLDVRILRLFDVYGPRMPEKHIFRKVINDFVLKKNSEENYSLESVIYSCYIDDVIDGIFLALESKNFYGPMNIGNSEGISLKKLLTQIGNSYDLTIPEENNDELVSYFFKCPNTHKIESLLKWSIKKDYFSGMDETISFFTEKPYGVLTSEF